MENKPDYTVPDKSDLGLLHLTLVTKLAILTGLGATGLLILMAGFVVVEADGGYFQVIQAHTLTRQHIGPAMIVTTLLLLAVAGLSAGIIALFSSFRVAGPLYRFSRVFQQARQPVPTYRLRRKDALQEVSDNIQASIEQLHAHYQQLRTEIDALHNALERNDSTTKQQYHQGLQRLKHLEAELKLHE